MEAFFNQLSGFITKSFLYPMYAVILAVILVFIVLTILSDGRRRGVVQDVVQILEVVSRFRKKGGEEN